MNFIVTLLLSIIIFFSVEVRANKPNTIISVMAVTLNNKNKPVDAPHYRNFHTYKLINDETKEKKVVIQGKKAKFIYLAPGRYCFWSSTYGNKTELKILNPICFIVKKEGVTNTGTWVIGHRISSRTMYHLLVDIKDNYLELESIFNVTNSIPPDLYKKKSSL